MKQYFAFTLKGKKLLSFWLIFLVLFIIPYGIIISQMAGMEPGETPPLGLLGGLIILVLVAFLIIFYFAELFIENVQYKGINFEFNGSFVKFVGEVLLGWFLTIITFGIYAAWFTRNIHRFFVDNTSYNNKPLTFKGKGSSLFIIFLLALFIPMAIVITFTTKELLGNAGPSTNLTMLQPIVSWLVTIPFLYFVYKWMVNIDFKKYTITWDTDFWKACGNILLQFILSILTLGIYSPLAYVKLYAYFTNKTVVKVDGEVMKKFGFEEDNVADFLFLWVQILFTIVTLGIYYPWAMCKIGSRFMSRTFIEE